MPTEKPRIQVTLDSETNGILARLAKEHELSKSNLAADLIRHALELREDLYLSNLAEERDTNKTKWTKNTGDIWD